MKICGIIAEYNPLHLGHLKQIAYVKNELNADKIVVVLSGNFVQRGEPAIMDKYKRAELSIKAGADIVIELPTIYAIANAETFAKGAVKILTSLGFVTDICFGVESGSAEDYIAFAKALNTETKEFKAELKKQLSDGVSLAKAKCEALKVIKADGFKEELISSPNNVLGLEYVKALISSKSDIEIHPLLRAVNHNDTKLHKGETSATSIREAYYKSGKAKLKNSLPPYVLKALPGAPYDFEKIIMANLFTVSLESLKKCPDCTEGLENRIKALIRENKNLNDALNKITTKRYTTSRIKRVMIASLLNITQELVDSALKYKPYAKVLAVKEDCLPLLGEAKKAGKITVLVRKNDYRDLEKAALSAFNIDVTANDIYNLISGGKNNEYYTIIE